MLRFRVFGGVRVVRGDGTLLTMARREQQLLACLLVRKGHGSTADELIDCIWGDDLPADPRNSLQVLVKRVRDGLGESGRAVVINVGDGYGLAIDHRSSDVDVFRRLSSAAFALRDPEPALAARLLERCVDLSAGELPEAPLESAVSDDIWELSRLRDEVCDEAARLSAGRPPATTATSAASDDLVIMVLRLAELDDMSLADVVIAATKRGGRVRRCSHGLLVVIHREAGAAVRAAKRTIDALAGGGDRLLGGSIDRLAIGTRGIERPVQAAVSAYPGQILVSRSIAAAAATAAPEVQLSVAGTDAWQVGFVQEPRDRLARPGGSSVELVGRRTDLDAVTDLVASGGLTTIRGPGGIGKSRLAREVVHRAPDCLVDGATVIDLGGRAVRGGALAVVALGLGILTEPFRPLIETVLDRLSEARWLLILDNCEDALEETLWLCLVLRDGCPGVRVLTTSRVALGAGQEQIHDLDRLNRTEVAELLAALAGPEAPAGAALDRLCELIDGMPLAAECAAALVRQLGLPATVLALAEVPDGAVLPLLDAAQGGLGRHRSVEAALVASWNQLDQPDRTFFERLSSLRGRFTGEDALVAAPVEQPGDVVGVLGRLRAASLVKQEATDTWSMLEPVRQFAATLLLRDGRQAAQAARHCAHFVRTAERHEESLRSPEEADAFARMNHAYPNLAAALAWTVQSADPESALRISGSLWWWWAAQGMFVDGAAALGRALGVPGEISPMLRAKALIARAHLSWWAGDPEQTEADCAAALELVADREGGMFSWCRAWALMGSAASRTWGGRDLALLTQSLEKAVELLSPLGDHTGCGIALDVAGTVAWHCGEYQLQATRVAAAIDHYEAGGHQTMIAQGHRSLGLALGLLGDTTAGRTMIAEGVHRSERIGDVGGLPLGLCLLGLVETYAGRHDDADEAFLASLRCNRERGQLWPALLALTHASGRAVLVGRADDGVRLLAAAQAITRRKTIASAPRERAAADGAVDLAARMLGPGELRAARAAGNDLGVAEALVLAIDVLGR